MDSRRYCILDIVEQAQTAIWKKRIWERIQDNLDRYPGFDSFSIQTVGRRVNTMEADGLLNESIAHMDETNRGLLQVYTLTDEGHEQIMTERERRLRDLASSHMETILGTGELSVTTAQLETLFTRYFEIEPAVLPETGRLQAMLDFLVDEFSDDSATALDHSANQEFRAILAQESPRFSL